MRSLNLLGALSLCFTLACGSTPGVGGEDAGGGDGNNTTDGGDNSGGNDGGTDGGPGQSQAPFPKEEACEVIEQEANLETKPVDIIMVVDNSASMGEEITAIENNINDNFANILDASGLDYRVILISKHGPNSDESICISSPLSGTSCEPRPTKPVFGDRFFQYDTEIDSWNALVKLLSTYNATNAANPTAWKDWLRPGSFKTIIAVTDDESDPAETGISPNDFENQLFALSPAGTFGTATDRQYILHGIIGIAANSTATEPYQPADPINNTKCGTAYEPGVNYQELAKRTGGLRFPVCETSSYNSVFQAAAQSVIDSAELGCEFDAPVPTDGTQFMDAYIEYTPGNGGAVEYLKKVPQNGTCDDKSFEADYAAGRITLCPAACNRLKADTSGKIAVAYACGVEIG